MLSNLDALYTSLTKILNEILQLDPNIQAVILTNTSGQLIDYAISTYFEQKLKEEEFYIEGLAATIAAMFGATLATGIDFDLGGANSILAEFSEGRIVIVPCDSTSVFALVTTKDAPLGSIRIIAKRYSEKLRELLPKLFSQVEKEIKTLTRDKTKMKNILLE